MLQRIDDFHPVRSRLDKVGLDLPTTATLVCNAKTAFDARAYAFGGTVLSVHTLTLGRP